MLILTSMGDTLKTTQWNSLVWPLKTTQWNSLTY